MSGHGIFKCKHGVVVAQCRCMEGHKNVKIVPCPSSCARVEAHESDAGDPVMFELGPLCKSCGDDPDVDCHCKPGG